MYTITMMTSNNKDAGKQSLWTKISTFDNDPQFLGGTPAGVGPTSPIPHDMNVYKNLKRRAKLPKLHSNERKFATKELEDQFLTYFEGEFAVYAVQDNKIQ